MTPRDWAKLFFCGVVFSYYVVCDIDYFDVALENVPVLGGGRGGGGTNFDVVFFPSSY